jgi:hypothetical protein
MVDALNLLLLPGSMSPHLASQLPDAATKLIDSNAPPTQSSERFRLVLWLIPESHLNTHTKNKEYDMKNSTLIWIVAASRC